jgi:hypothetical protein
MRSLGAFAKASIRRFRPVTALLFGRKHINKWLTTSQCLPALSLLQAPRRLVRSVICPTAHTGDSPAVPTESTEAQSLPLSLAFCVSHPSCTCAGASRLLLFLSLATICTRAALRDGSEAKPKPLKQPGWHCEREKRLRGRKGRRSLASHHRATNRQDELEHLEPGSRSYSTATSEFDLTMDQQGKLPLHRIAPPVFRTASSLCRGHLALLRPRQRTISFLGFTLLSSFTTRGLVLHMGYPPMD